MVHASHRADPGVRVRVGRRQPAGARVGLLARVQDDRPARGARPALPGAHVSEAATQLHLVGEPQGPRDRKSTRLNSSHLVISYAVFCLKKKNYKYNCNSSTYMSPTTQNAPTPTS